MSSKRKQEGYLLIDHRASPGTSPELLRAQVGIPWVPTAGEGELYESATVTCSHCQRVVILNPQRTRPRHYCQKCDHYVCDTPSCAVECRPMARRFDQAETEAHRRLAKIGVI